MGSLSPTGIATAHAMTRRALWHGLSAAGVLGASGAMAQAPTPPPPAPAPAGPESLAFSRDAAARMTLPVTINGQGPFPFVVDTGSDRTVISQELAASLNLPLGPHVLLQHSGGADDVQTVVISRLGIGERVVQGIDAPVLAAANLGAQGMLGIDSLRNQHIVIDFKGKALTSAPSQSVPFDPDTIVVRGRSQFGQLILMDSNVHGRTVYVIVDSGAEMTVGNRALQRLLAGYRGTDIVYPPTEVISVTGKRSPAELENITEMHVGGLTVRNVPLAFADLHTFERFGLADKPAMLLGMDVLSLCARVTVDFRRREASFTLN